MKKKAVVWTIILLTIVALCLFPWQLVTHKESVEIGLGVDCGYVDCRVAHTPRWSWISSSDVFYISWVDYPPITTAPRTVVDYAIDGGSGTAYRLDGSYNGGPFNVPRLTPAQVVRRIEEARQLVEAAARNGEIKLPDWWSAVAYREAPVAKQAEGR